MIQLKKKHTVPVPVILANEGVTERASLCHLVETGSIDFIFDSKIYGHSEVKKLLGEVQDGKCCFCEAKILHISYGDVEHYRPKGGWIQNGETLNKPGYYWLAYDWDNLFLSCQICNQRHKKNFFPLEVGSVRVRSHNDDIESEFPIFIKPDIENPEDFIEFKEEIPFSVDGNLRGKQTIEKLALDRETLNESRRSKLVLVRMLYNLAKNFPETNLEIRQKAINGIKKIALEYTTDNAEYAAMFRAFFKKNPIDF